MGSKLVGMQGTLKDSIMSGMLPDQANREMLRIGCAINTTHLHTLGILICIQKKFPWM